MINSGLFGVCSPAWAHPAIEGSALLGVAIRCSQLEARLFELSLHFTWSSHVVSATTVQGYRQMQGKESQRGALEPLGH